MSDFRVETGDFKGNKTLSILKGENRVVSFGLNKAIAILESVEEIKKFVEENKKHEKVQNTSEV